jgi:flagellar hook-associated protein 1
MSISLGLQTALSGLMTNQQALNTISQNVVNVNTPGYTRKILKPESRVVAGIGAGVQVTALQRDVDEGLLKSLRSGNAALGALDVTNTAYGQIEDMFGKVGDQSSIGHNVQDILDKLVALSATPDKSDVQLATAQSAQTATDQLNQLSTKLQSLRASADQDITDNCNQINNYLSDIYDLNNKIIRNLAIKSDATDLQDKRDTALTNLSKLIDIKYYNSSDGSVSVGTSQGRVLVTTSQVFQVSHTALTNSAAWLSQAAGQFDAISLTTGSGGTVDITKSLQGGSLAANVDLRDTIIPNLQAQLDQLAKQMTDTVNLVHNRGAAVPQVASSYVGSRSFADQSDLAQSISLQGTGDTALVVYDSQGNQQATTTLRGLMDGSAFSPAKSAMTQPWGLDSIAGRMQSWLQGQSYFSSSAATVGLDASGHFSISTGNTSYGLAFRDQADSTPGAAAADLSVIFHADTSTIVTTSNTTALTGATALGTGVTKLDGVNAVNAGDKLNLTVGGTTYSYTVAAADTGTTLQSFINGIPGLSATFVTNGAGVSGLQIVNASGESLSVASGTSTSLNGLVTIAAATPDETVKGFSNFLGLNDFFSSGQPRAQLDSTVLPVNTRTQLPRTLTLYDRDGQVGSGMTFAAGSSLDDIAKQINSNSQILESGLMPQSSVTLASGATLNIADTSGNGITNYAVPAGPTSLQTIAAGLMASPSTLTAKVVNEGSGYRLRVWDNSGRPLAISYTGTDATALQNSMQLASAQKFSAAVVPEGAGVRLQIRQLENVDMYARAGVDVAGGSIMTDLGLGPSASGQATNIAMRSDLLADPSSISHAATQWNADTGKYYMSSGDNTVATQLVSAFNTKMTIGSAGRLSSASYTLADYATMTVSMTAQDAAKVTDQQTYQSSLSESLNSQYLSKSAVNLDEEVANMINYQQAYSASAKVISTLSDMLDVLVNIVK